jgi:hypothetical protein
MERSSMTKKSPVPAAVTFVGGLVTLIAVFLPWRFSARPVVRSSASIASLCIRSRASRRSP